MVNRPFASFDDFLAKVKLSASELESLIKVGAFDNIDADRHHHECRGIGEVEFGAADFPQRGKVYDLELMNRIGHDLVGPFFLAAGALPAVTSRGRPPRRYSRTVRDTFALYGSLGYEPLS